MAQFIPGIYNNFYHNILGYFWGVTIKLSKGYVICVSRITLIRSIGNFFFFLSVKSKYYKKETSKEYTGSGQKEAKHTEDKKET